MEQKPLMSLKVLWGLFQILMGIFVFFSAGVFGGSSLGWVGGIIMIIALVMIVHGVYDGFAARKYLKNRV